jgi:hypothetical protein
MTSLDLQLAEGIRGTTLPAGISRPTLTNILNGRFGTRPEVAARLMAYIREAA